MLSRRQFMLGTAGLAVLAACGDDGEASPVTTTSSTTSTTVFKPTGDTSLDKPLPPIDALALVPLIGDDLDKLGLRLTNRGGLIDTRDGQYVKSAKGNHLALYAEPTSDAHSDDRYVKGIRDLTVVTAPVFFAQWPRLESYDICQEPPQQFDNRPEPVPFSQIAMTRAQVSAFDWKHATLASILKGAYGVPKQIEQLTVSSQLSSNGIYQQALQDADVDPGQRAN